MFSSYLFFFFVYEYLFTRTIVITGVVKWFSSDLFFFL